MTVADPTVVLVHGAFTDASGFARVTGELLANGFGSWCPLCPTAPSSVMRPTSRRWSVRSTARWSWWGPPTVGRSPPSLEPRTTSRRARMTIVEVDSSHLVILSHPKEVVDLIQQALDGVSS
jgi:hypothetical protein